MPETEICENREQCVREQQRLIECLDELKAIYSSILQYATSSETSWWSGDRHDEFITNMKKRKEQLEVLVKQAHRELQFFDHWDSHLKKLNGLFEELLSFMRQAI